MDNYQLITGLIPLFIIGILEIIIYYKIFLNESIQKKLGKVLFYENDYGYKKSTDYMRILFYFIANSSMAILFYVYYLISQFIYYIHIAIFIEIFSIYFATLLYLRKRYLPFRNEEEDMRKRQSFIRKYEENDDNPMTNDYIDIVGGTNILANIVLAGMLLGYYLNGNWIFLLIFIIFFIMSHSVLFSDYLYDLTNIDLRRVKGTQSYFKVYAFVLLISVLIIFTCVYGYSLSSLL